MGHLPAHSNDPQCWTVYDLGGGAGKCRQLPMVHGLFLCLTESRGSHTWLKVAMGKGEGAGDRSLPLVRAFWEETGIQLTASCTKLCWELPPRGVFGRRERGTVSHAITFIDDVAMHIPSLEAWDQFVWLPGAAMPWATTEVEQYSYHCRHTIDLSQVMPVTQFRVTDEEGTYLCVAWALVFERSILAYNPTRDEVEWVPTCGIANDLSWAEERSAVVLVNFVPHIPQEAACIARLGACRLMSWPDDSSSEEEEDGQAEEEDGQAEEEEDEGEEEEDPTDVEEQGEASPEPLSGGIGLEQGETEQEVEPWG